MADTFRWEEDLSVSFCEYANPRLWTRAVSGTWVHAKETTCSEGRADLVWGRFHPSSCPMHFGEHAELLRNPTVSRILAASSVGSAQDEVSLFMHGGVSLPVFRKALSALLERGLLRKTVDNRFRIHPRYKLPNLEICSFELKLTHWQRALYQATRYRSFSHRVFVVMPYDSIGPASENRVAFEKANIGLIAHHVDGKSEVVVRPQKRKPFAQHRLIMALGSLTNQTALTSRKSFIPSSQLSK